MIATDCLRNRHFLVVDDESFIRTLVTRFLKKFGAASVVEATDGREAIALIGSYDMAFDAVITDVNMKPVNGIDLLRAIRTGADGLKRNMPVLVLTVHAEAELVAEALALDADAFVLKPVKREELIERVLRALERTIPIASSASYAAVGGGGALEPNPALALAPAPPSKPLEVSAEAFFDQPPADDVPVPAVQKLALNKVKANSILARDIHIVATDRVLLAAPVILTRALLDRLMDLSKIHDASRYVFVFEPA